MGGSGLTLFKREVTAMTTYETIALMIAFAVFVIHILNFRIK